MLKLGFLMVALLQISCITTQPSDVQEFQATGLQVSCAEANDLESDLQTVVSCVIENTTSASRQVGIDSAKFKQGSDIFLALNTDETLAAVQDYLSHRGVAKPTQAAAVVGAVGMAYNPNSGAVASGTAASMGLSEMNDARKIEVLQNGFGPNHAITEDFEIPAGTKLTRRSVFPYGIRQRGARSLELCLKEGHECRDIPLNNIAVMRGRG